METKGKDLKERLYEQIEAELSFCDKKHTPFICENIIDGGDSKQKMVKLIADYVVKNRTISQAILDVERDFNPNIADSPYFSS